MLIHIDLLLVKELINKYFKIPISISDVENTDWHNLYKLKPFEVLGNFSE